MGPSSCRSFFRDCERLRCWCKCRRFLCASSSIPADVQLRAREMAATVTTRFAQDNSSTLWKGPRLISVRPVEYASNSPYRTRSAYRSRHPASDTRSEPASALSKRIFDATAASLALLFFAPLFIAIAIAIKTTSRGPVFFQQYRYGYRNRLFKIYKFRSMHVDLGDVAGVRQTVQSDSRVTRVGKILRSTK